MIPSLSLLDATACAEIHEATLDVLARAGVRFASPRALAVLREAGAEVDDETQVARLPRELVEQAVARAPREVLLGGSRPGPRRRARRRPHLAHARRHRSGHPRPPHRGAATVDCRRRGRGDARRRRPRRDRLRVAGGERQRRLAQHRDARDPCRASRKHRQARAVRGAPRGGGPLRDGHARGRRRRRPLGPAAPAHVGRLLSRVAPAARARDARGLPRAGRAARADVRLRARPERGDRAGEPRRRGRPDQRRDPERDRALRAGRARSAGHLRGRRGSARHALGRVRVRRPRSDPHEPESRRHGPTLRPAGHGHRVHERRQGVLGRRRLRGRLSRRLPRS